MKKLTITLILALCILPLSAKDSADEQRIQKTVDQIMSRMTLEQKVAQLFMVSINRNEAPAARAVQDSLVKMGLGGIIIMRGPVEPFMERMNELQSNSRIPIIVSTDAEWGANMRFSEYPHYPMQYQLCKMQGRADLMYKMGRNVAKELRDLNIHVNLAPVADMVEVPSENSSQRDLAFGVGHATEYGDAYMRGMQDYGISACAKHFPSHGDTNVDTHRETLNIDGEITRERYDSVYLVPFRKMIDDGIDFVMMGHHSVSCLDPTLTPSSISKPIVNDLLRRDLGFSGIVTTDALGMEGVAHGRTPVEVNIAAYKAGIDILLMPLDPINSIRAIADSLQCGAFPMDELDARVRKVLSVKARKGFFDEGYDPIVRDVPTKVRKAVRRDNALIRKMNREIRKADPYIRETVYKDPTLQMDLGRD